MPDERDMPPRSSCGGTFEAPEPEPVPLDIPGMPPIPEGWELDCDPRLEWRPADKNHVVHEFIRKQLPNTVLEWSQLPSDITALAIPVLYCCDARGEFVADLRFETRMYKKGAEPSVMAATASQYWLIHRPKSAIAFEAGNLREAMVSATGKEDNVNRHFFLRARAELEKAEAFDAFKVLFKHYSFNEELWRLEKWMQEFLPFDLEEHPGMARFRDLLTKQAGHLRGDEPNINGHATTNWYTDGSPLAGITNTYVKVAGASIPTRCHWLIEQCRKEGFKKVAEWGSVEGVNLFHYWKHAPEIEWHGFEARQEAVERGNQLAKEENIAGFSLVNMVNFPRQPTFDAVSLFEVLEHNEPWFGGELVHKCLDVLRPHGVLYISTPCGNWSACDEHTRDMSLRKDHINAFTPERMRKFLNKVVAEYDPSPYLVEDCEYVENSNIREANGWVFSRIRKLR